MSFSKLLTAPLLAFALAVPLAAGPAPAVAQEQAAPPIPAIVGVVDVQRVLETSKAGQGVKAALEARRKAGQAEIDKMEKQLKAEQDQLNAQRAALSPADFQKKDADLRKRVQDYRKAYEEKRRALDKSYSEAMRQMTQALQKVIIDTANRRKLTLVLNKATVILSAEGWDITEEVLQQFNKALPAVKIERRAGGPGAGKGKGVRR